VALDLVTYVILKDMLVVRGKCDKDRTVYLNEKSIEVIEHYMEERERQMCKRMVQYIVEKNILATGLDTSKYSTHKLRHTAATLLYKHSNVDIRTIQKILGHKNIGTTQVYTHVDDEDLRKAVRSNPLNK